MGRHDDTDRFLQAAHALAVERLRQDPAALIQVKEQLARWRTQSGQTRSDIYWNRWQTLLDDGDIDRLEATVCGNGDEAQVLRSVSPVSVLMTQRERMQLLRDARRP